jgi:hypothetical protein
MAVADLVRILEIVVRALEGVGEIAVEVADSIRKQFTSLATTISKLNWNPFDEDARRQNFEAWQEFSAQAHTARTDAAEKGKQIVNDAVADLKRMDAALSSEFRFVSATVDTTANKPPPDTGEDEWLKTDKETKAKKEKKEETEKLTEAERAELAAKQALAVATLDYIALCKELNGETEEQIRQWRLTAEGATATERALSDLQTQTQTMREESEQSREQLAAEQERQRIFYENLGAGIFDVFASMVDGSEAAVDALKRLAAQILATALTAQALKALGFDSGGNWGFQGVAKGAAYMQGGARFFAQGGVVAGPTPFVYGGGRLGVMGEAGPEAVMPLKRGPDGKLGVGGGAVNVAVHNYAGANVSVEQRGKELQIVIDRVTSDLAGKVASGGNPFTSSLERAYGVRR